jgi:hypothetical protein
MRPRDPLWIPSWALALHRCPAFRCRFASRVWLFVKYDEIEDCWWLERRGRNKGGVDYAMRNNPPPAPGR